jgi:pyruvate dehydrogenase E1 component beta subunit
MDPRTIAPLDLETIMRSVEKTGRVVLVDHATRHASVTAMIAADIAEHRFGVLKAPIVQVTAADTTIPYSEPLEAQVIPDETRIVAAARRVLD